MKILVNALLLKKNLSGVQYYIENLLSGLGEVLTEKDKLEVILSKNYSGKLLLKPFEFIIPPINADYRVNRIWWENVAMPFFLKQKRTQHFIYHSPGYVLPLVCPIPSVVTVHDLIALQFPELCMKENALYFNWLLPQTIRKASRIIAVSETVKQSITSRFKIDPDKIDVIHHGVKDHFKRIKNETLLNSVSVKYNLPKNYILFVGNLEPKKNLPFLIRTYARLRKQYQITHSLVIVGQNGWKFKDIYTTVKNYRVEESVRFLGYIPDEDMPCIYNLSDLFVFPSLYEGFGIPVIEAMACGVPVIVSNRGALPEINGNCSVPIDPLDETEWARIMFTLLSDKDTREVYIDRGLKWSAQFSWRKSAKLTLESYTNAIKC